MLPKTVFETQQTETTIYNKVETLYEDRELAVIYKPEGLWHSAIVNAMSCFSM